ncbi:MAG: MYG1 family protein [Rhabdochlamydiaceae bacterium]|nr:MYG1 family protein [Rhabdochlamydiaceae bacterium]
MQARSLGTHDGSFHADEVTAAALLLVFNRIDRNKIIRSRELSVLDQCEYVCDVGSIYDPARKRFDHHQVDYNGELSSAGMVLRYLYDQGVIDKKIFEFYNESLILGVDAHDNGRVVLEVGVCTFSQVIANFVPPVYDAPVEVMRQAFDEAVDFAAGHLRRLLERYKYVEACREVVESAMSKQDVALVFDRAMPWMDVFFEMGGERHPAQFVIMPSGSHWKLRGIPPSIRERMKVRVPLPEKWAGLMDEQLKKASGIEGAIFCHKGRFISVWETKEDAMKALERVIG